MSVYINMCLEPKEAEGVVSPGTGVMDGFEPPWGRWESNPGPLQEQPVVLLAEPISSPSPPGPKGMTPASCPVTGTGVHSLAYMHAHLCERTHIHTYTHTVIKVLFSLFVFLFSDKTISLCLSVAKTLPLSNHGRKGFIGPHLQVTVHRWGKSGQELRLELKQKPQRRAACSRDHFSYLFLHSTGSSAYGWCPQWADRFQSHLK